MELALHGNLVDAVDVVVNLVWKQVLYDIDPANLGEHQVWHADWLDLRLFIWHRGWLKRQIFDRLFAFPRFNLPFLVFPDVEHVREVVGKVVLLLVRIIVNPGQPVSPLGHMLHDNEVIAIDCRPFYPKLEALVFKFEHVVHLNLVQPMVVRGHEGQTPLLLFVCQDVGFTSNFRRGALLALGLKIVEHQLYLHVQAHVASHQDVVE